jgi:hypothetical protein
MKISKQYLKQIIKEELAHISEGEGNEKSVSLEVELKMIDGLPDSLVFPNDIQLTLTKEQKDLLDPIALGAIHTGEKPVSAYK